MRIAFIVGEFPIMSEYFILNQITGLIDCGHEVDIFPQFRGDTSTMHSEVDEYKLLDRTFYEPFVPSSYFLRTVKGLKLMCANGYKAPKVVLLSLNVFKYGRSAVSLRKLYQVVPYLRNRHYEVIHCHFGPSGLTGSSLRNIGAVKGKLVVSFHGYDVTTYVLRRGEDVYRELFKEGDLFTYNSEATRKKLMRLNCPSNKLLKLPMGVDLKKRPFIKRKVGADGQITILSVGRLVEMKGREYAIKAVAKVVKKFPNINYVIVGDGPLREELQNLIKELGVATHISLTGWVSSGKLSSLYKNSHLFLHPSVTSSDGNMEGQGVVLLEAQAYGLPVVATKHNAFPETVVDGESAFLVPERDVDALAEKLGYLIEHPEIWPEMGRAGCAYVEANYDIKKLNNRLVEIYERLLNG